jgi:beta-galactosidase
LRCSRIEVDYLPENVPVLFTRREIPMNRTAPLFALGLIALSVVATPAAAQRQRLSMDPGWRFILGDPAGAEAPAFDDHAWRRLDLPHDWSIEGTMRQDAPGGGQFAFLPGGIGWYRKAFRLPAGGSGQRAWLEFDGAYMNSDVWINGVHLGRRPYGYSSFAYDISRHFVPGINVVAVRVDNSAQPNSRWYAGSGIYRHVWLSLMGPVHVGHWGTWVTTPRADSASAEVVIRTRVENDQATARRGTLRSVMVDASGLEVARSETPFAIDAGQGTELEQRMPVTTPRLWSVETPYLYSVRSEVLDGARATDAVTTPIGIRSIAYDSERGFLLNGRRVKMNGVNLHHDGGGLGAAVPERVWERRLELLKTMGVNAIRTSHNPPAPEFLDLCDRLGFLVMAEAFDEWTIGKVPEGYHRYFAEWSERDVTDFVHRDRNHPSIVLWSAGNEIGEQTTEGGAAVLRRLVDIFHREDPTRPVTTGNDNIAADGHPATLAFLSALDIVGYNYVDRWHERRELFADQDRHDHPDWRMIGTESGSIFQSFDEQYSLGNEPSVVRPNYTSGMVQAERRWKWVALHDYFAGDFMWTGVDYLGEAVWPFRGFPSGVLDITGQPKDSYYMYQSQWTARPVLHLFPHWNWPGRNGQVIPVLAYTNCNSVELFLNGRSLGEKRLEFPAQGTSGGWNSYALPLVNPTTTDLHLSWDVPYEPGELRAVGRLRNGEGVCVASVRTAGPPAAIRLSVDRDTVTAGPGDVAHISVEIVDSAGTVVPTAGDLVRFAITGGEILALDNADLRDRSGYRAGERHAFNGRELAIVRAALPGVLTVMARAGGLRPASVSVPVVRGVAVPTVPAAR